MSFRIAQDGNFDVLDAQTLNVFTANIANLNLGSLPASVQFDYVVVGGGTAGCSLAAKLSNDFTKKVLVVEAGANLTTDPAVLAPGLFASVPLGLDPKYSKVYQANFSPGNPISYSDGRGLGGGSMHNGMQCYRGTPTVWNQWATSTGDSRWSYNNLLANDMLPFEHYTPNGTVANPAQRGTTGPLYISQEPPVNTDPLMIAIGTVTGSPQVSDLNDPTLGNVGIGANQNWATPPALDPSSVRSFSANAYLLGNPVVGTPGIIYPNGTSINTSRQLTVMFDANCNRVLFDALGNAIGVEVYSTASKQVFVAAASAEVILCAGSIADAAILQRSGVGDATLLNSLGIPVVFANSNVGANMSNHYGAVAVISAGSYAIPYPRIGSGFIDLSPFMPAGTRRFQLITAPFPFTPAGITQALQIPGNSPSIIGINVVPKSVGNVQIISQDPFIEPEVNLNFYSDGGTGVVGSDAYNVVSFYKIVKNIATAAGNTVLFPPPADYLAGDAALLADAQFSAPLGAYHNSCTCRMGTSAATAVCGSTGKVFGVNKLRCADNSIAPLIEDGNTGYQAYVVGAEIARAIQAGQ